MAEGGNRYNCPPFEHGDIFGTPPTYPDYDPYNPPRRHEAHDSSAAALDAAILDLTRRRLAMQQPGGGAEPPSAADAARRESSKWERATSMSYSTSASSLAARQHHLQQQQQELEHRQRELEIQRQHLLAGMQEHAKCTSMLAAEQNAAGMACSQQQQWWVCQVCQTKAFASLDEALHHEMNCCPEPHKFDPMAAVPIPLDSSMIALPPLGDHGYPMMSGFDSGLDTVVPSAGPFTMLKKPTPLAMASDKDWLTPLHCFVRRQCVQVFTASQDEVSAPSKGKRKPIQVGQVGIRCPHCHSEEVEEKTRERGSVYYPTSISSIYNATMNLLQRHLHNCSHVPADIMRRYETLKNDDARSGTSKRYWIESALSLGLVDTPNGIRCSALTPPPLPRLSSQQYSTGSFSAERRNSNDFFSCNSNAVSDLKEDEAGSDNEASAGPLDPLDPTKVDEDGGSVSGGTEQSLTNTAPLVTPEDELCSTKFSFHLISQMQPCVFTEADRLGKRKGLPPGFPGLACRHCFGGYGSGRFFPSSIKTLSDTSKTLNVLHTHMMRCRKCPQEVRDTLGKLRVSHDEERGKMKFGSQKAFFAKVWERLHHKNGDLGLGGTLGSGKRKSQIPLAEYAQPPPFMPTMATHAYMDTRYFGYPIAPQNGDFGTSPHNSFTALDAVGSPLDGPDTKRRRST
jgi:hypothetical protein